jgi:geranylgeranyl diphosphate synthase type 3
MGVAQVLLEPYSYLRAVPGKEIRSQLIDAFNVWLKLPEEVLAIIKTLVAQLHTASLMCVQSKCSTPRV